MASRLIPPRYTPLRAALDLIAWICLAALGLIRLWAAAGGRVSGWLLLAAALVLSGLAVTAARRLHLMNRLFFPWGKSWKTAAVFAAAAALGAFFDTSYAMLPTQALLLARWPFRLACALGSGLVFAGIVLALITAARRYGPLHCAPGRTMLVLALAVNLIAAYYLAGSATVYGWDGSGYWTMAGNLAAAPFGPDQLRQVAGSVITLDYNYLLAWPISLVMRLLGDSRYVFLLASVNFYVLPGLWGLCVLGRRIRGGGVLLFLFTPMLLYAALVGFVDVAAAGLGVWAFALYTDPKRPAAARGILAGALLAGTFLLRRYFVFFAASFGAAALLAALGRNRREWRAFLALFASAAACALFFTQSFLMEKVLGTDYGTLYSAYNLGLHSDWMMLARYFGLLVLILAAGLGAFLLIRRPEERRGAVLALCQLGLCFALFTRIQTHGQQHILLYLPAAAWLLGRGTAALLRTQRPWRPALAAGVWILAACTTASACLPREQPNTPVLIRTPAVLPSFTYAPPRRDDIVELIALRSYVDSLSAEEPKTVSIAASSFGFNGEIYANVLRSLNLPEGDGPKTQVIYMATVDKRDPFSWNVLLADYLLVADPVQTHLGEENQQIMALLAHDVLEGTGVGTAYRPLDRTFQLSGGMTVRIYARTRNLTGAEYWSISDRLTALYPGYADQYLPPEWVGPHP